LVSHLTFNVPVIASSNRDTSTISHPFHRFENFPFSSPSKFDVLFYELFFLTVEIEIFITKTKTIMTGNDQKWKAQKQQVWLDKQDQLLSDWRWWMCSVGIGVWKWEAQKQQVWFEVHRSSDQLLSNGRWWMYPGTV